MKALVTGGAGFIGSHLVELLLKRGYEVTVVDNLSTGRIQNLQGFIERIKFIEADLSRPSDTWAGEVSNVDYVYHLASLADIVPSIEHPIEYFQSNVTSTANLLACCDAKTLKKFVYAASSSCYGLARNYPTSEAEPISPEYPYALTKRMGEELVLHWNKVYGLKVASTRFFNVYGTRSRTSGTYGAVFGIFLAQKLAGAPLTIVGDGKQVRDFTYVSDICNGLLLAGESNFSCEVFNLASGKPQSINYLAQLIGGDITYIPKRPGEPDMTNADITKAKEMLGYQPTISFEEGVKKVLLDIEYWREAPVWTPEAIADATKVWFNSLGSN